MWRMPHVCMSLCRNGARNNLGSITTEVGGPRARHELHSPACPGRCPSRLQCPSENVFLARELKGHTWTKIRDDLGFRSVGAAQEAYRSAIRRNALPNTDAVRAGIVARQVYLIATASSMMETAKEAGDHMAAKGWADTLIKINDQLLRVYGAPIVVDLNVSTSPSEIIDAAEKQLLAIAGRGGPAPADDTGGLRWTGRGRWCDREKEADRFEAGAGQAVDGLEVAAASAEAAAA